MVGLELPTLSSIFDDEPADRCSESRCVETLEARRVDWRWLSLEK